MAELSDRVYGDWMFIHDANQEFYLLYINTIWKLFAFESSLFDTLAK